MRKKATLSPHVVALASRVRRQIKKWVRDNELITTSDLGGACAVASYALWSVLKANSYEAIFICNDRISSGHCWVEVDGFVLDITATQFNCEAFRLKKKAYRPVFVLPTEEKNKHTQYCKLGQMGQIGKNQEAIKMVKEWPMPQQPLAYFEEIQAISESFR